MKYVVVESRDGGFGTREFDTLPEAIKYGDKKYEELKNEKVNLFIVHGDPEDDDFFDSEVVKKYKMDLGI